MPARRARLVAAAVGAAVGVVAAASGPAPAFFAAPATSGTAVGAVATVAAGAAPVATVQPAGGDTVVVTFAEATTSSGAAVAAVVLRRSPAAGGPAVTADATCTVDAGTERCTETQVPDGTWTYTDTAQWTSGWLGAPSPPSPPVVVDTTPPTVTVTYPTGSVAVGSWPGAVYGSAADGGSGVAGVSVAVEDVSAGTWWDGSGFAPAPDALAASGTTSWALSVAAGALVVGDTYQVTATATDGAGHQAVATASFTVTG